MINRLKKLILINKEVNMKKTILATIFSLFYLTSASAVISCSIAGIVQLVILSSKSKAEPMPMGMGLKVFGELGSPKIQYAFFSNEFNCC